MNKKVLTYGLGLISVILVIIILIPSKEKEVDKGNQVELIENKDINIENNEEYSSEELERAKEIAVSFSENIYNCDMSDQMKYPKMAVENTTKALKERTIKIAEVTPTDVYKRTVTSTTVVEYFVDTKDKTLSWSLELMSNIYDEEGNVIGREKGNMIVVFMEEDNVLKVGEYSIRKHKKEIGD